MNTTRDQFKTGSLLTFVREAFLNHYPDKENRYKISTVDALMSALAVFSLKYPSLLQFDKENQKETTLTHNLRTLFQVTKAPCDTQMRERLDGLGLTGIGAGMKAVIARLQRGKVLENWKFLNKTYLVPLDGTGFFSSHEVHCACCCEKHHKNGEVTYSHQMVVGSIVHPSRRIVFCAPLCLLSF